ncbi:glutamine cyclotransferase [bacterium]|nr:glutamine cyclotransferase [bacterium]
MRNKRSVKIEKTFETGVPVVGGVAFDGEHVWFSDPANRAIARVDRSTGKVRSRLRGPVVGSGTAWDGKHLWQVGDGTIQCVDARGKVVRELPLPKVDGFVSGLGWDGEALWAGDYHGRRLLKLDPETGRVLRVLESDRFVTGITWIGDELWHAVYKAEDRPAEIRRVDEKTGRVLARLEVPCTISGMAYDGERLWCGDCDSGKLRAMRLASRKRRTSVKRTRRKRSTRAS